MNSQKRRPRKVLGPPFRPILPHPPEPDPASTPGLGLGLGLELGLEDECEGKPESSLKHKPQPVQNPPPFPLTPLHLSSVQHSTTLSPLFRPPSHDHPVQSGQAWAPKNLHDVLVPPDVTACMDRKRSVSEEEDGYRRETKKLKEKERRDRMHTKFSEISSILGIVDEPREDRISILGKVLDLVRNLQEENSRLHVEMTVAQHTNQRLAAFIRYAAPETSIEEIIRADPHCWDKQNIGSRSPARKEKVVAHGGDALVAKPPKLLRAVPRGGLLALGLRQAVFGGRAQDDCSNPQSRQALCQSPPPENEDTSPLA